MAGFQPFFVIHIFLKNILKIVFDKGFGGSYNPPPVAGEREFAGDGSLIEIVNKTRKRDTWAALWRRGRFADHNRCNRRNVSRQSL
jgi:hypothetical protein